MNIEMINNHSANPTADTDKNTYGTPTLKSSRMNTLEMGFSLDITGKVTENAAYGKEDLKSAQEIAQTAGMQDVTLQRNYMAVMSNSMSSEDYAKLTEEGVIPTHAEVTESVTNLDKIKIKLAEAGVSIVGFNDNLSEQDIEAVVGSKGRAASIAKTSEILRDANLPDTEENVRAVTQAVGTAVNLQPLTNETMKYMLENDVEPTIENLYKSEYSSGIDTRKAGTGLHYEGAATYASAAASETAWEDLKDQAFQIVEEAGISVEEGLKDAKWLVENQVPLTKESLENYENLKNLSLPANPKDAVKAVLTTIAEGKDAIKANLNQTESLYDRAIGILNEFAVMSDDNDITKRRQLEEVRLAMTAEANLVLLRKGIHIETEPLEILVKELKEAEQEFYKPLLENPQDNGAGNGAEVIQNRLSLAEKIDLYKASRRVIEDLPTIPINAVAESAVEATDDNPLSLSTIHERGIILRSTYEKAGETYEALMTAPRADMGDSIRKAFANVDDILNDLGYDINDTNRKTVRALGYSSMPITKENIETVREAQTAVGRVIELMNPARTLKLIREGHNPLDENIYNLEKELSEEPEEITQEKYSEYLWKLEKNSEITENEKQAYIGLYRLFRQIEKQDGRVIGNVLSTGQELTMQNMLAASRSNRAKNMDVRVDEDYGMLEEIITKGDSISNQIMQGFLNIKDSRPIKSYVEEKLRETRLAAKSEDEISGMLEKLNEPVTVENIIAMSDMVKTTGSSYKKLFGKDNKNANERIAGDRGHSETLDGDMLDSEETEKLLNDFTDRESAAKAYDELAKRALGISERRMEGAASYDESRQWSLLYKQISFARNAASHENYEMPMVVGDEIVNIHLTIKHIGGEGRVGTSLVSDKYGKVDAQFVLKEGGIDGLIVSDSRAGVDALKANQESFKSELTAGGLKTGNISYVFSKTNTIADYEIEDSDIQVSGKDLYSVAKAFITSLNK